MIKFALDLLCLIQERTLDCKYGGNKEVKALIESLNDCNLLIDDIYLHDGCYWKINSKLADVFPGTWSNQKEIGECDTYDTNGEQVKVSPGNAEIGIQSTYSLLHRCHIDISVSAGKANEKKYVYRTVSDNVLHIMDSGYLDFKLFDAISSRGGYFLSKLRLNSAI